MRGYRAPIELDEADKRLVYKLTDFTLHGIRSWNEKPRFKRPFRAA